MEATKEKEFATGVRLDFSKISPDCIKKQLKDLVIGWGTPVADVMDKVNIDDYESMTVEIVTRFKKKSLNA